MLKRFILTQFIFIKCYDFVIVLLYRLRSCRPLISKKLHEQELDGTGLKILLLAPHYDDEILGAYGFLLKEHNRQLIELAYITDGKNCLQNRFFPQIEEVRRRESLSALQGINFANKTFLSFPDGELSSFTVNLEEWLHGIFEKNKYNYILTTAPDDRTPDHRVLSESCIKMSGQFPEMSLLFYRSTWSTFPLREADFLYGCSANKKFKALRQFKSQNNIPLINTLLYSIRESQTEQVAEGFIHSEKYFRHRSKYQIVNMLKN